MGNPLRNDILGQGENLRHVLDHLYGPEHARLEAAARLLQNPKPIVFIGMGSATYVNIPAEFYLGQHGRFAGVVNASDALYSLFPALKQVNVVMSSRSGETVEVVKLGRALVSEGIPFLAVTNEPDSTLANLASGVLWFDSHKDDLVSINIVTAMMVTLLALSAETLGRTELFRAQVRALPEMMDEVIERAWRQGDALAQLFRDTRPIYTLYRDASKGMGQCARLVLEEVAQRPSVAMEAGEFRQGAIEVLDETLGAIISLGNGDSAVLNQALARDIHSGGGRVLKLGSSIEGPEDNRAQTFSLPSVPTALCPILEIVPVQVLAYKLAELEGRVPGVTRHLPKVITTEVGIPRPAPGG